MKFNKVLGHFLKLMISVMGVQCDHSSQVPQILSMPLIRDAILKNKCSGNNRWVPLPLLPDLKNTGYTRTIEGQNVICNEESPLGKIPFSCR